MDGGVAYAVTELLEGETLHHRLAAASSDSAKRAAAAGGDSTPRASSQAALPVGKAIDIATQIARGLAAAHDRGIVHRDLKPENVFLARDGHVKILDFGLARQMAAARADARTELQTEPGMVLGTVGYMAPEQIRGEPVDGRADLFASGVVLYEMLTGTRAFHRDTPAETMTAILKEEAPELCVARPDLPPGLDRIVRHALEKDPNDRFQSARDLVFNLQALGPATGSGAAASVAMGRARQVPVREVAAWSIAAVVTIGAVGLLLGRSPSASPPPHIVNLTLTEEAEMSPSAAGPGLLVSPDGTRVFLESARRDRQLIMRVLGQPGSTPLPNTELARVHAISPDARWVLFATLNKLKKVSLIDNSVTTICSTNTIPTSAAVSADGQVVFATGAHLWLVPAAGGTPRPLTTLDPAHEQVQVVGGFLPDGRTLLFTNWVDDASRIEALTLATGARRTVIESASGGKYVSTGHVLFVQDAALMAARFNVATLTVTGTPVRVLDRVRTDFTGLPKLSVSSDANVLVYGESAMSSLVWVTRNGLESRLDLPSRGFEFVRLAGDGRRLAFSDASGIWVADLARGGAVRISSEHFIYGYADWSPDGSRVAYSVLNDLVERPSDGTGTTRRIAANLPVRKLVPSWSPDGKWMAYGAYFSATNADIYVESLDGSGPPRPFVVTPAYDSGPQFSPDGHFLAFASSVTGRLEVYVTPFPGPGPRWPVSTNGGTHVRWSRDGHELYYRSGDDMMAVTIATSPSFTAGKPVRLFHGRYSFGSGLAVSTYDVAADGRFLMIKNDDETVERPRIIVNWAESVKRLTGGQ